MLNAMSLSSLTLNLERLAYTALRGFADGNSKKAPHLLTGERGEDAAFFHLRGLGYTIVARRWRSNRLAGDLDLVAWDGDTLVIFEVKTRTARDLVPAAVQVDFEKQRILRKMAVSYLHQLPELYRDTVPVRFDVVSIYLLASGTEFEHLKNAFAHSAGG